MFLSEWILVNYTRSLTGIMRNGVNTFKLPGIFFDWLIEASFLLI